MTMPRLPAFVTVLLASALAGCGFKGPLKPLPKETTPMAVRVHDFTVPQVAPEGESDANFGIASGIEPALPGTETEQVGPITTAPAPSRTETDTGKRTTYAPAEIKVAEPEETPDSPINRADPLPTVIPAAPVRANEANLPGMKPAAPAGTQPAYKPIKLLMPEEEDRSYNVREKQPESAPATPAKQDDE